MPDRPGTPGGGAPPHPIRDIALITSSAASLSNFRAPLIRAMAEAGLRVRVLAPDFDPTTREAMHDLGAEPVDISLERSGMRLFRDLADFVRLYLVLRRLRPDATFAYFIKPVLYGGIAARLAGVPRRFALMAGMGYVFTPGTEREGIARRALRLLVSRLYKSSFAGSERIFFHNTDDLEQLARAGLIAREKGVLLGGTGVDLSRFAPAPPVLKPLRFLLIARLLREKGIAEYAAAARIVKATFPAAEFHLAGGADPSPGALPIAEVEAWQSEGLIHWHGQVDDVRPLIASSSVYVLPSYREGKPRSTQEAMAMARPVITTDAIGCRDTVVEGVNGFKIPVRDADALAAAMMRFLEAPELIAPMSAESRGMAEEMFDVHRINRRILDIMGLAPPAGPLRGSSS